MLWGDVEEAIKAERLLRIQRIERLSTICALFCLSGAVWLAWPILKEAFVGDASLLTGLGMPVLVLCGVLSFKISFSMIHVHEQESERRQASHGPFC